MPGNETRHNEAEKEERDLKNPERDAPDAQGGNTRTECDGGVGTLVAKEIGDADGLVSSGRSQGAV